MLSVRKLIIVVMVLVTISSQIVSADWKEDAKAIDISGGKNHTLILTESKSVWACGPNG